MGATTVTGVAAEEEEEATGVEERVVGKQQLGLPPAN
jgi:hypothetical protein